MKEFFGIGGYQRQPEGFLSWQHLLFVSLLMIIMTLCAVFLGKRNRNQPLKIQNRVLIWSAVLIDGFEMFKIMVACAEDPHAWTRMLPLFLCSIQLLSIPLAAFTKGRIKEAAMDFICVFGILGAVLGTYGAGQNYNAYPVLSFDNVVSGFTHSISGFVALYLMISGMTRMDKRNIPVVFGILTVFCIAAYIANVTLDYNYMFLMAGDGTPYDIFFNLLGGHPVFYPVTVIGLFFLYIFLFYTIRAAVANKLRKEEIAV